MSENTFAIKYWAEDDQPREKLRIKGKSVLSDAELITIIIGSGNRNESALELSKRILASVDNNLHALGKLTLKQLTVFNGIGEAKAVSIIAAMELGRRRRSEEALAVQKISSSKVIFEIMQPLIGELPHEEFWIICLNNSNKVLCKTNISRGGITGTVVDARLIFNCALEHHATSIILVHNHPSGKLEPSQQDIQITNRLQQAGKVLEIPILDHVIVTENSYFSFVDEGLL